MPLILHEEELFFTEINHLITRYKQSPVPTELAESVSDTNLLLQETEKKITLLEGVFLEGLLTAHHRKDQIIWISNMQRMVRIFSDAVYGWRKQLIAMHQTTLKKEWMHRTEKFLSAMQSFNEFLQKDYSSLFDDSQLISNYEQDQFWIAVSCRLKKLNKRWNAVCKADPRLVEIALLPVLKFQQSEDLQFHDHQNISFLRKLLTNLEMIDFKGTVEKDNQLLRDGLMRINYNHPMFLLYRQDHIRKAVDSKSNSRDQLLYLWQEKKQLQQILYENNKGYNNKNESAHVVLDHFLEYEIYYLERTINTLHEPAPSYDKTPIAIFTIPASSIGILLRVMVDIGVIKTSNLTQMLIRLIPFIQTKKKDPLTEGGFRNDFYSTNRQELNSVKDLLFEMIKGVNRLER